MKLQRFVVVGIQKSQKKRMANFLLVDDEPSILHLIRALLRRERHDVEVAHTGETASQILDNPSCAVDVLVSDMKMERTNSGSLLEHAKRTRPGMPVILVTAYNLSSTDELAESLDVVACLQKPFGIPAFLSAVERALGHVAGSADKH